ncbi:MAG TPA: DUF1071 domain-containing protein [Nitrosomonas sp.]|nr:DUF1071 domain-containing protein [Nitrosomonas sp.]
MKTFNELRKLNVSEHIEKKNGISYLSWTYAVDELLQADPTATWEFLPHMNINDTVMVQCKVNAFGKSMTMHLAVFDYKNQAIKNPNACQISNSMMRCLVKCIACFGIGLYIYAGEDLPEKDESQKKIIPDQPTAEDPQTGFSTDGIYRIPSGTHKGRTLPQVIDIIGQRKLEDTIISFEDRIAKKSPYSGFTMEQMQKFVSEATAFVNSLESENSEFDSFMKGGK